MFGTLPAWGLWLRHARDITIDGMRLATATPDARPRFLAEDVQRLSVHDSAL